jgi:MFS family permease
MLGMGFVSSWAELMTARWFLGLTEAGLFPGISYYLSCWYRRSEFGVRMAIFFSAAAVSGSFGGLLAAAIENLNGKRNISGWAWIFIIEGACTVLVGFASYFIVVDFPAEATFLSKEDRARVLLRLKKDKQSSAEHEEFKMVYLWEAIKDWKTYAGAVIYMGPDMALYSFSLFLPSIIENMSFTNAESVIKNQLLSVPPYVLGAILTVACGFWSDRVKRRGIFNICLSWLGIVGFIMLISTTQPVVQYIGTFLAAAGIYPCIPMTISWVANNVEGVYKRGIAMGIVIGWGNVNGVVSSNIYRTPPRYYSGHGVIIGYLFFCLFLGSAIMLWGLKKENKKKLAGKADHLVEGKSAQEIYEIGDRRPDFIYHL